MTERKNNSLKASARLRRPLAIIGALIILAGVIGVLLETTDTADIEKKTEKRALQPVSVLHVAASDQPIRINVYAAITPRWTAGIASAVAGRVLAVSDNALAGKRVKKGDVLVRIDPLRYEAEVAAAELAVKQAELALWQAENATLLARKQFARDGRKPPNKLALKLPQLDIAQANLKQARTRRKVAAQQRRDTDIVAPFSGFVTSRAVSPGRSINVGDTLLTLIDDRVFELVADIGTKSWRLLDHPLKGQVARLLNEKGEMIARAKVRAAAGFLDQKTRQHKIFLDVSARNGGDVKSGDFVQVSLAGKTVRNALSLPEAARTQEGFIWFLDAQNRLQRVAPTILYRDKGRIIIRARELGKGSGWRVATTPLASFLPGQRVLPVVVSAKGQPEEGAR